MMVDKLNERLKQLAEQKQQAIIRLQQANNDIIAIDGAMQEVRYWISQLEKESEVKWQDSPTV